MISSGESTGFAGSREGYLFLSLLQARTGTSLLRRMGDLSPDRLPEMSDRELGEHVKLSEKARRAFGELRREFDAEAVLGRLAQTGASAVTLADGGYPERLREMPDPPPALFVRGTIPEGPAVALVGSRKASVTGIENARELGRALGERGVCVVSGLALGIDAAAHEGALASGGPTAGVLGCGIDVIYPRRNRELFERVRGADNRPPRAGGRAGRVVRSGTSAVTRVPGFQPAARRRGRGDLGRGGVCGRRGAGACEARGAAGAADGRARGG